ncbi:MAG TPA: RagB/SusD family nutrient uptake outer membrane protein [Chitinophaga sp.]|uniref:RagB/SusD family nutrient uptake outer membrane protein n=1 Tax=Chitinophaga sp. TaxID=1869181 RepID=UPI002D11CEBB|nr:RagB/SusD family nutrient uptake outer membrane protein [Chitinophaga sp.]HVI48123.1 RagB/SusD family nutrient uptake outer membrane protein [Chitinophaga sp.]
MKKIFNAIILLLAVGFISCKKMLDIPSHRALTEDNMWQNKNDARAGLDACYALLRAAMANENAHWVYGDLRGRDFQVTRRGDLQAAAESNLNASFSTMAEWRDWRRFYAAIAQCNLTINKLPEVVKRDYRYSPNDMRLDLAQAQYLRAFLYYYMVRIWGDVPLVTTTADGSAKKIPRENQQKVLDYAAAEAYTSIEGLPWKYNGQSPEQQGDYRGQGESHHKSIFATKGMAYTLLAHIYAWKENYAKALEYADIVINSQSQTGYNLSTVDDLTRLNGGFRGRTDYNIFQIDMNFDHAEISTTGQLEDWTLREPYIPKRESEIYVSKDSILNIYGEAHDQRPQYFFTKMEEAFPMFYKMKQINNDVKNPTLKLYSSCIIVFRYEELYLLRAECRARLGMDNAVDDLNTVRNRRSLKNVNGALVKGNALLDAILLERRRELIGEGWYWYDLVHFKKVPQYTRLTAADVSNGAVYWPLSQEALSNNPALVQNNFWK